MTKVELKKALRRKIAKAGANRIAKISLNYMMENDHNNVKDLQDMMKTVWIQNGRLRFGKH